MALYIPASRRRRRTILFAALALVAGLVVGLVIGRASSPSVTDHVRSVQEDARRTAAALRVLSLHEEAGVASDASAGGGTDLVLQRTSTELQHEFDDAPWLAPGTRAKLLDDLNALAARTDRASPAFGQAADSLASEIEATFGIAG